MELARCNGIVLVERDGRLELVERGGGWIGTAMFISALLTVLTGIAGSALAISHVTAGYGLIALAGLAATATVTLFRRKRQHTRADLGPPWLVLDTTAGEVRDRRGVMIGQLAGARLERVFQMGSSSKALALFCPDKIVLARGTPFGDDVEQLEQVLRQHRVG